MLNKKLLLNFQAIITFLLPVLLLAFIAQPTLAGQTGQDEAKAVEESAGMIVDETVENGGFSDQEESPDQQAGSCDLPEEMSAGQQPEPETAGLAGNEDTGEGEMDERDFHAGQEVCLDCNDPAAGPDEKTAGTLDMATLSDIGHSFSDEGEVRLCQALELESNRGGGTVDHYRAAVLPEDGASVTQDEPVRLNAIIGGAGPETLVGSARFYIPLSLTVDQEAAVEVRDDWGYSWDDPTDGTLFGKVLSLWALFESAYLSDSEILTASFTATPASSEEHILKTEAWSDANLPDLDGDTPGGNRLELAEGLSEPRINVAVESAADLDQVRQNPNWHYVQRCDLNLAAPDGIADWTPIGDEAQPFWGGYDGGDYRIMNLTIDRPGEDYLGLFGVIETPAIVTGVSLIDLELNGRRYLGGLAGKVMGALVAKSRVEGSVNGAGGRIGGLIGWNDSGKVFDSHVQVSVAGDNTVGGLVGFNGSGSMLSGCSALGSITRIGSSFGGLVGDNYGLISSCWTDVTVGLPDNIFSGEGAGGLVGVNRSSGVVENSFALGHVNAPVGHYVGGLVGDNRGGNITDSYASGAVRGGLAVGGLVGLNRNYLTYLGAVDRCYSSGQVIGTTASGGLVGHDNGGIINDSFYAEGQPANGLGTALHPADLFNLATYAGAGWPIALLDDFDPYNPDQWTWYIDDGENYPVLWWELIEELVDPDPPGQGGSGTGERGGRFSGFGHKRFVNLAYRKFPPAPLTLNSLLQIVNLSFLREGGWNELNQASVLVNLAVEQHVKSAGSLSEKEQIASIIKLAVIHAILKTVEARLTVDPVIIGSAADALAEALVLINENSDLLVSARLAYLTLLLDSTSELLSELAAGR